MSVVKSYSRNPVYRVCRFLVTCFSRSLFRIRVIGPENIPAAGPLIICSNHIHNFDPPILGSVVPRFVHFMAKSELFRGMVLRNFMRVIGAFPVKRGGQDKSAIKYALAVPKCGGCLMIFPEGHRSKTGVLGKGMPGIAFIARKSGSKVLPVAMIGPYRLFGRLTIRFGNLIEVNEQDTNEHVLEVLMSAVQELVNEGHAE
jgi:1-acyl-sn-glycerol-3-phosphate acyltransferase